MPDLPIVIPDTAAAPKDYTLSGTQELQLKTVRALIDGSGAASPFLPTLQLLDPNGHVMWEGATSTTVAAGGSADVSWFPGLGVTSSGSTGSTVVMPYATVSVGSWNWAVVGATFVDFGAGSVSTTDSSVFQDNSFVSPTAPILIMKAGIYLAFGGIGPWNPAWGTQAELSNLGADLGTWSGAGATAPNYPITFAPVGGVGGADPALVISTMAVLSADPPGGSQVRMEVQQNSGATRNVGAFIRIVRLTADGLGT